MAELPKLLQRLRSYRQAADPARAAAIAADLRANRRAATGDAGSIRSGPRAVDHPARRREATPVGYAQEAAAAKGHPALHRAAVDSGHGDRPAHDRKSVV